MNFSRWQTLVSVIVPQSWPVILPPAVAFAVGFIKDTALVSQVGVFELTFRGKELNNRGLFRHSWCSAPLPSALLRDVLSPEPLGPMAGATPCIISK